MYRQIFGKDQMRNSYLIVFLIFGATEKKHRVCWTN